jgi:ABC-type Fe3+ transport system substrate-binding protein
MMTRTIRWMCVLGAMVMVLTGCRMAEEQVDDPRRPAADAAVREKWDMSLDDLPTVTLIAISSHHEDIQNEFEWAFSLWHAEEFGQKVDIDWRDTAGGGTTIEEYILNCTADGGSADIDILWGGGELMYVRLGAEGGLSELTLSDDVLAAIPGELGGVPFIDADRRWVGSAVSAFGFLYNKTRLAQLGVAPPEQWADLGRDDMFGLICLADPTQSSSSRAAMELIVQSGDDWPTGWARLLDILANASQFVNSASAAADAPVQGTAAVATAIDFYGANRVAENPDALVFVLPAGEVIFTPDPIAILANPPHAELAQRFVDFVVSLEGQALLTLPVASEGGPIKHFIGRTPIRQDFSTAYADRLPAWTVDPYAFDDPMTLDIDLREAISPVLPTLVRCAAVNNQSNLRKARESLMAGGGSDSRDAFYELPEDARTLDQLREVSEALRGDEKAATELQDRWQAYFKDTYRGAAE